MGDLRWWSAVDFPWFLPGASTPHTPLVALTIHDTVCFRCPNMKLIRQTPENQIPMGGERSEVMDWLAPGQSCSLQIGGANVVIRLIERKGRRARISITATPRTEIAQTSTNAALH